MVILPLFR